jgi:hypothetical protein
MVYGSSIEGGYGIDASVFQVDASHPDRIDISDAELLFGAISRDRAPI